MKSIYVIGSLRNENIPVVSASLRDLQYDVFDDWYSAGPEADDYLRDYYRQRGLSYSEALNSYAAKHIFEFDKKHLDRCDSALLVYPAGRSAHLELGYVCGLRKPAYVLMDGEPERYDLMLQFATKIFMDKEQMLEYFNGQLGLRKESVQRTNTTEGSPSEHVRHMAEPRQGVLPEKGSTSSSKDKRWWVY